MATRNGSARVGDARDAADHRLTNTHAVSAGGRLGPVLGR
jgi:hypothetical protein